MNDVTLYSLRQEIATPQTIGMRQVLANSVIDVATKAKNWPLLHEAVDVKIEDQREYVGEWDRMFGGRGGDRRQVTERVTSYEQQSGISKKQVSRWRKFLEDVDAYHDKIVAAACRKAGLETEHTRQSPNSGEEQWYTPAQYIEAAREVMGGIDLDPASHEVAQRVVRAECWYGPTDDGLSKPWHGRVWLNPPYSYPAIEQFTGKLVEEYLQARTSQGILVTNNCTDTAWFHASQASASMLCFTKGRIAFYGPNQVSESPLQGQCFFYFGERRESFRQIFSAFGFCRGL